MATVAALERMSPLEQMIALASMPRAAAGRATVLSAINRNNDDESTQQPHSSGVNWLKFEFNGDFKVSERPMLLHSLGPADPGWEIGWRVWDAGIILAKYAEQYTAKLAQSSTSAVFVELGAGTGVAGLGFALCGCVLLA